MSFPIKTVRLDVSFPSTLEQQAILDRERCNTQYSICCKNEVNLEQQTHILNLPTGP